MTDSFFAYKFTFSKKGMMKYISHLDIARLFQRAGRRADVPFLLSQGFNRRPKISFERALKLGVESEEEKVVFRLKVSWPADELKERLQAQLPDGISIKKAEVIK